MHVYHVEIEWTGNTGSGTFDYRSYKRSHNIHIAGKPVIHATSDSAYLGDPQKHNPEDLFVASISACHMLWYLHLCSRDGVIVMQYTDNASGHMVIRPDGSGYFERIHLAPRIVVTKTSMIENARELHEEAHRMCFLANSCKFPITHAPDIIVTG